MRNKLFKHIFCLFCFMGMLFSVCCQTNGNQTHRSSKYQTTRVRHTPRWNATTSQNTTYYLRKNSTRKSHDGHTISNYNKNTERSHNANRTHQKSKNRIKARAHKLDRKINRC